MHALKEMHGSKNVDKENHPETSSKIQAKLGIQEVNLGMFVGRH